MTDTTSKSIGGVIPSEERAGQDLTFIFVDMVNSSAMLQDEPERATAGVSILESLRGEALNEGATNANFTGDGFMAAFSDAGDALTFALHVVATVSDRSTYPEGMQPVPIRTGLHTGAAVKVGSGELVGVATSATSRISDAANPGQILASQQTVEAAGQVTTTIAVCELGWFRVTDFAREFQLHGVHATSAAIASAKPQASAAVEVDPSQVSMWSMHLSDHPLGDALDQLDQIAGVGDVRDTLRAMLNRAYLARTYVPYPNMVPLDLDSVFVGSRGVGKSIVAARLATALKALGVLGSDNVIEIDTFEFAGFTASEASHYLDAAGGHLLFFKDPDRVATLVCADPMWAKRHGGAFTQLVDRLNHQRRRLQHNELSPNDAIYVVLAARVSETVDTLIDWNVGFSELFGEPVVFSDLNDEQLCDVFVRLARESRYDVTESARQQVSVAIDTLPAGQRNARGVTWLFENTRANFFARLLHPAQATANTGGAQFPPGALAARTLSPQDISVEVHSPG